jgi:hypothetical protein
MSLELLYDVLAALKELKGLAAEWPVGTPGLLQLASELLEKAGLPCVSFKAPLPAKEEGQVLKVLKVLIQCPKKGEEVMHDRSGIGWRGWGG